MIILGGMDLFFEASKSRLATEKVKIDQHLFLRHIFGRPLVRGLSALFEKDGKHDVAAIAADCTAAYLAALQGVAIKSSDGLQTLMQEAAERSVKVVLVTQLPDEAAKQVFSGLLGEHTTTITENPSTTCVYGWENWRRACRKAQLRERLCVAVASPASSRGALAAAMRVVTLANPLQEFIDCSGVDMMTDGFPPAVRASVMGLLKLT